MEQFSLDKWLQDKSRKVVTREGKDVEIIHTNSPVTHHPIVGFIDKSIYTWTIDGKLIYGKKEQDKNDLFFADEEEELTEFEKELKAMIQDVERGYFIDESFDFWKNRLLDLAKKELEKEDWRKPLRLYKNGYEQGKRDALKDLPKWKKFGCGIAGNPDIDVFLIRNDNGTYYTSKVLSSCCTYIELNELDKLPKEE